MNIYLLTRETTGYDEVRGFVVCAENEGRARFLAASQAGDEGADEWLLEAGSDMIGVTFMSEEAQEGVVLRDYRAG